MCKVSVIVPVYKVEKYLERCVESLRKQTLQDIEIILVDDGSPDNCPAICDRFAGEDTRIKVVHQANKGLSGARNSGLSVASGDCIAFIDSDDYAAPNMMEKLYRTINEYNTDFVMCDYYRVLPSHQTEFTSELDGGCFDYDRIKKELYPQLIMTEKIDYGPILSVCRCMYKRDFLCKNKLEFDEKTKLSEDCLFSSCVTYKARRFYYMKGEYLYFYNYNPTSLSSSYKDFAWTSFLRMNSQLLQLFSDSTFDFSRQIRLHMLYFTLNMLQQIKGANFGFHEYYKTIHNIIHENQVVEALRNLDMPTPISWKLKIIIWLIKFKQTFILAILCR